MDVAEELRDIGICRIDAEEVAGDDAEETEVVLGDSFVQNDGGEFFAFSDREGEELADAGLGVGDHVVRTNSQRAEIGRVEPVRRKRPIDVFIPDDVS